MKHFILCVLFLASTYCNAQTPNQYQPYSFQFYQRFNKQVYSQDTKFHSVIKPYLQDDSLLKINLSGFMIMV
jgi:hypothetical protein